MTDKDCHQYGESMGYLVGRAARVIAIQLNRNLLEAGFDATVDHWITLSKLTFAGGMQQQDLSFVLGRDKTAITRLIDAMEESHWVERKADSDDRRIKRIYITHEGSKVREQMVPIVEQTNKEVEQDIDPEALQTCKQVLNQIFENAWHGKQ